MAWEEYKFLADVVLKFDQIIFSIKQWSVTTFSALLAIYYTKPLPGHPNLVLWLLIAITCLYWAMEYMYKRFQSFHITRSRLLDVFLNNAEQYETYRVPDNLFLNRYDAADEKNILTGRGFVRTDPEARYSQQAWRWQFALNPQTSAIYIFQIACSLILILLF